MTCNETQERLAGYVFDELGGEEKEQVRRHVETCEACRAAAAQMRAVTQLLRDGVMAGPAPVLSSERRVELLRRAAADSAAAAGPREEGKAGKMRRSLLLWPQAGSGNEVLYWRVLGLAAVLMLLVSGFALVFLSHAFRYVGANSELARLAREGAPRYDTPAPGERDVKAPAPAIELALDQLGAAETPLTVPASKPADESVTELADAKPGARSDVTVMPPAAESVAKVAEEIAIADTPRQASAIWAERRAEAKQDKALGLRVGTAGQEIAGGAGAPADEAKAFGMADAVAERAEAALPQKTAPGRPSADAAAAPAVNALARLQAKDEATSLRDRGLLPELGKAQVEKYRLVEKEEAPAAAAPSPGIRAAAAAADGDPTGNDKKRQRGTTEVDRDALAKRKAGGAARRLTEGGQGGVAGAMAAIPASPPAPAKGALVEAQVKQAPVPAAAAPARGDDSEAAVQGGLRWLQEHQNPDGSWSESAPAAMTGLGLLAFLAHGDVPLAAADSGRFGVTLVKAMQYLVNRVMEDTGPAGVALSRPGVNGIVTVALSEAYGVMRIPYLKPAAERGLQRIIAGQQANGGFSHEYGGGGDWDLAVSGWQVQALVAGRNAGLDVPGLDASLQKARDFLKKDGFRMKPDRRRGCFLLTPKGPATLPVQSIGTLALHLAGEGRSSQARAGAALLTRSMDRLMADTGADDPYASPFYGWYCETWALRFNGFAAWRKWSAEFYPFLRGLQQADGGWMPPVATGPAHEYDPYFATALACLSLQAGEAHCMAALKISATVAAKEGAVSVLDDDLAGLEIEIDPDGGADRPAAQQREGLEETKR
ncbi:MAG: hypothetical protein A3K19_03870 [Lentisphaerae bacterium RIFOXYB12_FULL_65_16]|nr:MAG: hypothetical protein A3K18_02995 [Lentisphaerae bacterium RIFOXYA12_64_32]OGV89281.1 MAG: hypothetical protein A3K19_03870 [Lentisphaerae bacterium RIFOXYB12_FULL_65_16]